MHILSNLKIPAQNKQPSITIMFTQKKKKYNNNVIFGTIVRIPGKFHLILSRLIHKSCFLKVQHFGFSL